MAKHARSSALQFGIELLQTVAGFVAMIYFARTLGSATLGQYFLALAVVNWVMIPTAGVRGTVQKRVSEDTDQGKFFTAGLLIQLCILCLLLGSIIFFRETVNRYLGFDGTFLVAGLILLKGLGTFFRAVLRAEHRVELAALVGGSWELLRIGLQVALILLGYKLFGLLAGEIAAAGVITIATVGLISLHLSRPAWKHFQRLYDYGKYAWLSAIKPFAYSWMDVVILGFFVTDSVIGIYEISWRITAAFILLPSAMAKVTFPYLSKHAENEQMEEIANILRTSTTFAGMLAIPGLMGAVVIGEDVLAIYGEEFAGGIVIMVILTAGRIGQSYETFLLQTLNAIDRPDATFRISMIFILANITLNVVLVSQFGAIGAAVATAVTMLLSAILAMRVLRRVVGFTIDWDIIAVQFVSAIVMAIAVTGIRQQVQPLTDIETLILVVFGAAVYFVGLLIGSSEARAQFHRVIDQTIP
ncbi:flippase [Halapricum desulfuricans]|uniref:MATE family membrane protein, Rfbx family n=1 Tax=Halapricum desulfuricans TaxID=2841257 RepID=A0A897N695_9EURY|nr:flippase [Halapricum desulfuricans]QSG08227.1 MATE family membrane protein, Rfbx family [Halapricum desulfuricans]